MPSRLKRVSSWDEPLANVARARQFTERYGVDEANAADYVPPLPTEEVKDWDDLLRRIE